MQIHWPVLQKPGNVGYSVGKVMVFITSMAILVQSIHGEIQPVIAIYISLHAMFFFQFLKEFHSLVLLFQLVNFRFLVYKSS